MVDVKLIASTPPLSYPKWGDGKEWVNYRMWVKSNIISFQWPPTKWYTQIHSFTAGVWASRPISPGLIPCRCVGPPAHLPQPNLTQWLSILLSFIYLLFFFLSFFFIFFFDFLPTSSTSSFPSPMLSFFSFLFAHLESWWWCCADKELKRKTRWWHAYQCVPFRGGWLRIVFNNYFHCI